MQFIFFSLNDKILFVRDDAESGSWQVEEYGLTAMFPFHAEKQIQRGQRIGFVDETGTLQVFEIRKVRNYEPDHYQEVTAEHIAVSELTDEFITEIQFTNIEPNAALAEVLEGTLWQVGNVAVGDLEEQARIRAEIAAFGLNGNVDLTKRPIVYPDKMQSAGYTEFDGDYATLYSTTYTWETEDHSTVIATVLFTPIKQNGTVFSSERMDEYVQKLFDSLETYSVDGLKSADTEGLIMHILPGDQIDEMEEIAVEAHDLSDEWENCIAGEASSGDIARGDVWQAVGNIRTNWNVYITPRVTFDSSGITGRYLDIERYGGVFRGLRLSIDKNIDEVGVTVDDTNVLTAIYAFGRSTSERSGSEPVPLTFESVVWTATEDHPAKPAGQSYLVNPEALALYGRNGRNRWGYFQNSNIDDPEILLQKAWESLKQDAHPDVTINCVIQDLYRLGYNDVPIRLHDQAIVEIRPTGELLKLEIVGLVVDLLNPLETRPTIGKYIPNIIYINREMATNKTSGGGRGQSEEAYVRGEFETAIEYNKYQISLRATQYDLDDVAFRTAQAQAQITIDHSNITSIVTGTGARLNENGYVVTDSNGNPVFTAGNEMSLYSRLTQNANYITSIVSRSESVNTVFDPETAYNQGARVLHDGLPYRFTAPHAAGPWTGTDVEPINDTWSRVAQEAGRIDLVVEGSGESASIRIGKIVDEINENAVQIDASKIYLNGNVIATEINSISASVASALIDDLTAGRVKATSINSANFLGDSITGGDVYATGQLSIGSGGTKPQGSLYFRGTQFYNQAITLGPTNSPIATGNFLGTATTGMSLNHAHAVTMEEVTTGTNAGKVQATIGAAVPENDSSATSFFDIAASDTYAAGRAAAGAISSAVWDPSTNRFTVTTGLGRTAVGTIGITSTGWSGGAKTYTITGSKSVNGSSDPTQTSLETISVSIPDPTDYAQNKITSKRYGLSFKVGGKTFEYNQIDTTDSFDDGQDSVTLSGAWLKSGSSVDGSNKWTVTPTNSQPPVEKTVAVSAGGWNRAGGNYNEPYNEICIVDSSLIVAKSVVYLPSYTGGWTGTKGTYAGVVNSYATEIKRNNLKLADGPATAITLSADTPGPSGKAYVKNSLNEILCQLDISGWYEAGQLSVVQRSVSGLSGITLASSETGTSSHTVDVTYDDNTTGTSSVSVNASAVYGEGWTDAFGYVDLPDSTQTSDAYMDVHYPNPLVGEAPPYRRYTVSTDDTYAYIKTTVNNDDVIVARCLNSATATVTGVSIRSAQVTASGNVFTIPLSVSLSNGTSVNKTIDVQISLPSSEYVEASHAYRIYVHKPDEVYSSYGNQYWQMSANTAFNDGMNKCTMTVGNATQTEPSGTGYVVTAGYYRPVYLKKDGTTTKTVYFHT